MRITVLTHGSRGDVQPLVALGQGLKRVGHTVRVAAHPQFAPIIHDTGLELAPVAGDVRTIIGSRLGQPPLGPTVAAARFLLHAQRTIKQVVAASLMDWWHACQGAEAIVFATTAPAGYDIARHLGVPCVAVGIPPAYPTRVFAAPGAPALPLGGSYNLLTYHLLEQASWHLVAEAINRWRRQTLGRPPWPWHGPFARQRAERMPILYGFSPTLVPRPPDWDDWVHVTGPWWLDQPRWQPPAALTTFLAAGPPPVYVGFGSIMAGARPQDTTRMIVAALRQAGQRGILAAGWGALAHDDYGSDMFMVDNVPHQWLFPQVAAVIHHGGAGTTAAALRAGVPSICVPFLGVDQRFWGERVAALGAGPPPVSRKRLSVARLAYAITTATTDAAMRARAQALSQQIAQEDGVGRAVEVIERIFRRTTNDE